MRRVKASPLRIRVPVARKATQVMRARKGRGCYRRCRLQQQWRRETQE